MKKVIIISAISVPTFILALILALQINGRIDRARADREAAERAAAQAAADEKAKTKAEEEARIAELKRMGDYAYSITHPGHNYDEDRENDRKNDRKNNDYKNNDVWAKDAEARRLRMQKYQTTQPATQPKK